MSAVHTQPVTSLVEGSRVLLKDLRILTLTVPPIVSDEGVTIRWRQIATDETGSLTVPPDQKVKVLCPGWCDIDSALEEIL